VTAQHLFASSVAEDDVLIEGADAHHAVRVLRLRRDERVTISDGAGSVVDAVVVDASAAGLRARVEHRRFVDPPTPHLVVVQAIPKAGKLDLVVQKLTEIGVDAFVPLKAVRSVPRWDDRKIARLAHIAREAAKQSRRAWLPVVSPAVTPSALPAADLTLVLHEEAPATLRSALPSQAPKKIALVIGPEGGFTGDEIATFVRNGARAVGLGPQILRTETAALVATTLILGFYGKIG
jgi:16S rRNA (uracil1498-N3)-methyltransferase